MRPSCDDGADAACGDGRGEESGLRADGLRNGEIRYYIHFVLVVVVGGRFVECFSY